MYLPVDDMLFSDRLWWMIFGRFGSATFVLIGTHCSSKEKGAINAPQMYSLSFVLSTIPDQYEAKGQAWGQVGGTASPTL